jgi:bifunctional enzyme CysN/CysC
VSRARLTVVTAGHIDHGKSTLLGRLLADAGGLSRGRLEAARARARGTFEYAHLLDQLKDEQDKGITIDAARVYFRGGRRDYQFVDAPGHFEFLRNMVTGAARADAALLVVDAAAGAAENTRRHAALLGLLGVPRVLVVVNKMDTVEYAGEAFSRRAAELEALLAEQNVQCLGVLPAAAATGDNVARRSTKMPWYNGPTVLAALEALPDNGPQAARAFRMSVQDVLDGCALGTPESGALAVGDEVICAPSMKTAKVTGFRAFPGPAPLVAHSGLPTAVDLEPAGAAARGETLYRKSETAPLVERQVRATLFWLGPGELQPEHAVTLRLGAAEVQAELLRVRSVRRAEGERAEVRTLLPGEIADCDLALETPLAFDPAEVRAEAGRFALAAGGRIRGGGLIRAQ